MASNEPVERLFVRIESDISQLLNQTAQGVDRVETELKGMDAASKRSFDRMEKQARSSARVIGLVTGAVVAVTTQLMIMARQIPRAFAGVIRSTLEANKLFEKFSTQFTTLLGGTEAAQKRVQELVEFNIKTPFELPEIVEASRVLEVFGGSLLATGNNLKMVGDIAAGVNRPIEDVALWIGRAYDALQNGRPFGITALALQRMGALSGDARAELERMQEQGVKGEEAWSRFVELVGTRFTGNMERLAETLVGIQSNLADFRTELLRLSGEKLFENIKEDAQRLLDVMMRNREPLVSFGQGLGDIAAAMERMATSGVLAQLEKLEPSHVEELGDAMGRFADAIERASDKKAQGNINGLIEAVTSLIDINTSLLNLIKKLKDPLGEAEEALRNMGLVGESLANTIEILESVFKSITNPLSAMIDLVNQGTDAWYDLNEQLQKTLGFSLVDLTEDLAKSTGPAAEMPTQLWPPGLAEKLDPIKPIIDEAEDSSDDLLDIIDEAATDMIDAQEERQQDMEELEADHQKRMADIEEDGARKRLKIEEDLQRDLEDLARETEQRRAEIMQDAQRDLEELAQETDEALANERDDFQTEERRDTEDHLRDMRRLTEDYLMDLDDAVKERDARAVVDLQRRYALESQRKEEDFQTNQERDKEDYDERLQEIRDHEAKRRQEIIDNRTQELQDLMANEQQKRDEIIRSHQEQLAELDQTLAERRQRENENYAERQAELDNALAERLETIAKSLSDEEDMNEDSARRLLDILNETFGAGGDIDKLMDDFVNRRRQKMIVEISFEESTSYSGAGQSTTSSGGAMSFQHGGTVLARKPTMALFGEAGPEVAQFIPLNKMGQNQQPQKLQIEFSGSAPPGIRSTERDQIAGVLMNALKDTGMLG